MKSFLIFIFSVLFTSQSFAKVVAIADSGFIIENKIHIEQRPEQIWTALVNHVDSWWPKDHTWWEGTLSIQPQAGGCFCEVAGNKSASHMTISYVEPNKVLRMTGGLGPLQGMGVYGALDWKITQQEDKTFVTLTYSATGINPDGFAQLAPIVDKVQGVQLNSLIQYLLTNK